MTLLIYTGTYDKGAIKICDYDQTEIILYPGQPLALTDAAAAHVLNLYPDVFETSFPDLDEEE